MVLMTGASPDGSRSNVISHLPEGSVITGTRADTDYIVTDYGVADLRHKDIDEKAKAIIGVAHPSFREELERDWHARKR